MANNKELTVYENSYCYIVAGNERKETFHIFFNLIFPAFYTLTEILKEIEKTN